MTDSAATTDGTSLPDSRSMAQEAKRTVLGPIQRQLNMASILVLISSVFAVSTFAVFVEVGRRLLEDSNARVMPLVFVALAMLGLKGLSYSGALLWTHIIDTENQTRLREVMIDKLRALPLGWFGDHSSGEVKKLLQDDIEAIHYMVAHARVEFVAACVTPVLILAYLLYVDWRLTLILLIPLVLYALALMVVMGKQYTERMREYNEWQQKLEETTIEFVDGIQVVRTFGQSRRAHDRFRDSVDGFAQYYDAWMTPMTRIEASASLLLNPVFVMGVVLAAGIPMLSHGLQPVDLLPFLMVGLGLGTTVLTVGYSIQSLRQADAACLRLYKLLTEEELKQVAIGTTSLPVSPGRVEFVDVRFGYRPDTEVIKGVSLQLEPGTITALVGPSGSGKSTLAKLLPRFYDVTSGSILIDGQDVRLMSQADLYERVAFVFQDARMLRDTVRNNLLIANQTATEDEIARAATAAQIHDRIMNLSNGYDSVIGTDANLSGGELQRLSIARALLADTQIVVMDEATAFADPESEAMIQDALAELVRSRTVLVIAHRLHTVTNVDQIVVLSHGQVAEMGTHEELLGRRGLYSELWSSSLASDEVTATPGSHDDAASDFVKAAVK